LILPVLLALSGSGCAIVDVKVTNPIPGMSKVAIVPFFDQTPEPVTVLTPSPITVVDGRRFAMAYFAELQKVPGFQVVPVGVTETAIIEHQLEMGRAADRQKLAALLEVDAIVIGAITDYDPYHPRLGLHVAWYSPRERTFRPGPPTKPLEHSLLRRMLKMEGKAHKDALKAARKNKSAEDCPPGTEHSETASLEPSARGQSPDDNFPLQRNGNHTRGLRPAVYLSDPSQRTFVTPVADLPATFPPGGNQQILPQPIPGASTGPNGSSPNGSSSMAMVPTSGEWAFQQPIMSYTRYFDGTDADLQATLRDYVELSGERRGGGWRAYLDRSEDFIRFTSHLMINEMFMLHGGEAKRRYVWKFRKYK
jgi:hypothetical protein